MMTTSTLVETVSINYEDFNESFLTCSTCLCTYDSQEHAPKLLSCSHSACKSCLERIVAATGVRDAGSFRCPICRETIPLPRTGISGLPPSFLINQLVDLMSRQRREVVPRCSTHTSQELLFCESCDCVFCSTCTGGSHENGNGSYGHTVIPFSTAIKRMSEILLYKANLCIEKLNAAAENVNGEVGKLDQNVDHSFELINRTFQEIINTVEKRRQEVLRMVKKIRDEKKQVLLDQLSMIQAEKSKVEQECHGLQHQVEVRDITKKISELNEKIDSVKNFMDPRENAFIKYEHLHNSAFSEIEAALNVFGRIKTSKTFPALCSADVKNTSAHLLSCSLLQTVDYHGSLQSAGGDPVVIQLFHESNEEVYTQLFDQDDGTYSIKYTPEQPGVYRLHISIFGRSIKNSPYQFIASEHINPIVCFGSTGTEDEHFLQPAAVAINKTGHVFVLDTGNSRIKVLGQSLEILQHFLGDGLEERGGTGIAVTPSDSLLVINWRTRYVTELNFDGMLVSRFTHLDFVEPLSLAVNSKGEILVVDNSLKCVFVLDPCGKLLRRIELKRGGGRNSKYVSLIAAGPQDEIMVADSHIQVFSPRGEFLREIYPEGKSRGHFGGITYDNKGHVLATHSDKNKHYIQVFNFISGQLLYCIDSADAKLKRPAGLAVDDNFHVVVVDLGNDCVKKYRYK
ncbi:tripartite motif-containing protein 2-like [Limulus polyphemus]|uniref:Tripartite motif-containing protein 2-like n=1 Tax=Limulus polyphemus TaxID=6850 RepID=A0ABM1TGC3_LIMPO|nr:tripartite motif-containing protein 2-like [Limulus polyphemus]XP_022254929.1 tripartite motif-containing protein 2-like [Limulus polyphemus]XP_022254930.1 tripartite motif-containing protein 2-like [Limulus polyphemus]